MCTFKSSIALLRCDQTGVCVLDLHTRPRCCISRANTEHRTKEYSYLQGRQLSHVIYTGHID